MLPKCNDDEANFGDINVSSLQFFQFAKIGKCPGSRGLEQASGTDSLVCVHSAGPSGLCFLGKMFSHE